MAMAQPTPHNPTRDNLTVAGLLLGLMLLAVQPWLLLALVLVGLVGWALLFVWGSSYRGRLEQLVARMGAELANSPCRYRDQLGVLEGAAVRGSLFSPKVVIVLPLFAAGSDWRRMPVEVLVLPPPRALSRFTGARAWEPYLKAAGITLLAELSVEAKATTAAVDCMRQARWSEGALERLEALLGPLLRTLENAYDNELLQPSIPQLQKARVAFEEEEQKLQEALAGSLAMLENLREFLTVPEAIRPILNFDLDGLLDPQQFNDVRRSYEEVVVLQESYRQLLEEAGG